MARCRIEYVLGNLVDNFSEDPPESRVARVKKDFLEYGLDLPQLQASDVGSAQAFLRCLALWRGKSPKENAAAKNTKEKRTNGVEERATAHVVVGPLEEAFVQRKDLDVLDVARDEPAQPEQPEDDFYVPGDDVPIDKILASQDEPVSDEKGNEEQELSTIEAEPDVEVEMVESLAVDNWATVEKATLRRVGSFSDMSNVDIRFRFPERDVDGELQIDEDALEDGELVSEDEKSTKSDVREETPKVEPYAPFFRTIDKNESRRCKTAFDKNTTVEEDFFAEEREKKKKFREMQKVKHELQVSRKKAEEERIRREMAAQNAEITDLTGSEPNSRDDTRPFCKVPPTKILFNKQRSSSSRTPSSTTFIGKPITVQVPRQNVSPMRGLHRFVDGLSKPILGDSASPVPSESFHPSPFQFNHRPEQHFATPNVRPIKETVFKEQPDQTNIRLNFDAFEILLKDPFRFHNIEFGDSRCHLFKKANDSDADLYPNAEFFTARFQGIDHKFCRLVINYLEDCTLPNSCYRRDCSIHVWKQYEIEHKRDSFKKKTHVDYRISRSAAGLNHPVKIGSTSEVTISASDVFNFNGYVAKHMPNTDTNDCVKTILGRPVPLIIIHALVSLRGAIKSASIEDWREIALELDIITAWPTPFGGKTFSMPMVDGMKSFTREEYANLLGHVVRELSQFYS
ncbi:unnamed protein product [Oikopleura dioica]|uniref:Uncharacterized protein n=1 Tax=Oikopleura dioica TaxID=34765 RepID=E4Z381_OIKDI|nr:unnamed protein product [Oikopleura dioica]